MPGVADLPLHRGKVPLWMLNTMTKLARAIIEYIIEVKGPSAVLAMLSDPLWFQAFNNVIGMDWDSSGSTTVVTGILKNITWKDPSLGIIILGGKGEKMKEVPREAERLGEIYDVDPIEIVRASKLAARADSSFLQDGYNLYIHNVIVTVEGEYIVVQQGMNLNKRLARRYHVTRFELEEPHSGIVGLKSRITINAISRESRSARKLYIDLVQEGPRRIIKDLIEANLRVKQRPTLVDYISSKREERPSASFKPYYKPVPISRQLRKSIEMLAAYPVASEIDLALAPGLGPKVARALALIADIIYGVPTSIEDPVTHPLDPYFYAFAIGGKDGVPYPFDRETALEAYRFLEEALESARLGDKTKMRALERLRRVIRMISSNQ